MHIKNPGDKKKCDVYAK